MIASREDIRVSSGTSGARPRPVVDPDRTVRLTNPVVPESLDGSDEVDRQNEPAARVRHVKESALTTPGCRRVLPSRRFDGRQHFGERLVDSSSCGEDGDASRGPLRLLLSARIRQPALYT